MLIYCPVSNSAYFELKFGLRAEQNFLFLLPSIIVGDELNIC